MNSRSNIWLSWAAKLMPKERSDWLSAMEIELAQIPTPTGQTAFAFGCFKTAWLEWAQSRRGLSMVTRAGCAFLLFLLSSCGIVASMKMGMEANANGSAALITNLCLFYMGCAALILISVRLLQIVAGVGFVAAISGWIYLFTVRPSLDGVPLQYLTAISIEAASLMAGLLFLTLYLGWLYAPETYDA